MNTFLKTRYLYILLFALSAVSCRNNEEINLLPSSDKLKTILIDTVTCNATTVYENNEYTSLLRYCNLGSLNNQQTGYTKGSVLVQFAPIGFDKILQNVLAYTIDSVVLKVQADMVYGDTNTLHNIHVYKLNSYIDPEVLLKPDFNPEGKYDNTDLAGGIKTRFPARSTMNIQLDKTFGDYIINADSATMDSLPVFMKYFNGLYITTDPVITKGSMAVIDQDNSSIVVYFTTTRMLKGSVETDTVIHSSYTFSHTYGGIYNSAYNVAYTQLLSLNLIEHDFSSSDVESALLSSSDSISYITGMDGVNTRITFPNLKQLRNIQTPISVHYAELIIPLKESESIFPIPYMVVPWHIKEDGTYEAVSGYTTSYYNLDGSLHSDTLYPRSYHIILTYFIKYYLEGSVDYNQITLIPRTHVYLLNSAQKVDKTPESVFLPAEVKLRKPILKIYYNSF